VRGFFPIAMLKLLSPFVVAVVEGIQLAFLP
jgi:hypothetical protein